VGHDRWASFQKVRSPNDDPSDKSMSKNGALPPVPLHFAG
jgi:hypothetical protein